MQWYMPVIPATWDAEIRRLAIAGQPEEIDHLQNNQSKMDWRFGSSRRVPAL
jgi:hypothetical protein